MKKILLILLSFLFIATACKKGGLEVVKSFEDYKAVVKLEKSPAVVGHNAIEIVLTDNNGAAVTDAEVKIAYSMPAMPGMPAMNYETETALQANKFQSHLNISMAGPWIIEVKITRKDKTDIVRISIDAI